MWSMRSSQPVTLQMKGSRTGTVFTWVTVSALLPTGNNFTTKGQNRVPQELLSFVTETISPLPGSITPIFGSARGAGIIKCSLPYDQGNGCCWHPNITYVSTISDPVKGLWTVHAVAGFSTIHNMNVMDRKIIIWSIFLLLFVLVK